MGFCPSTNWCRISQPSTVCLPSDHDHVAQIHVPTRHFREALLSLNRESPKFYLPERHQTMAIYGNQNNINNSKSSKMSNQNVKSKCSGEVKRLGTDLGRLEILKIHPQSMTAGPRHPGNQKPAELTIFFEVTIDIRIFT